MKIKDMQTKIAELIEELEWEYDLIGIRFEDKEYQVGDAMECSRNNTDREDEREFPVFGSVEYNKLEEMDGTSTWDLKDDLNDWLYDDAEADARKQFIGKHGYIVVGNKVGWEQTNGLIDEGELLIKDAKVECILW